MIERRYRYPLLAAALAWVIVKLQWAHALAWDEVEFFRATKWMAEGRVPFRDFWEHHLPLQWMLFAPVAAFVEDPGATAILVMRWAQVPLWIATFVILFRIMREAELDSGIAILALVTLLTSFLFIEPAIEYRIDVPANLAYLAALLLVLRRPRSRGAWIAFGALMSASVLANLRMVYLVIATAVLVAAIDHVERRWRFKPVSLWMAGGVALVAIPFTLWLMWTKAIAPFLEAMRLNATLDRVLAAEAHTLGPLLVRPFTALDAGAMLLFVGGFTGMIVALREIRKPGVLQLLAILTALSVFSLALLGIHYPYHLQTTFLLLAPVVAALLPSSDLRVHRVAVVVVAVLLAIDIASLAKPALYVGLRYQDAVMAEADRHTRPDEKVFDGVGYALRREPAYRYWFMPSVVRLGADRGMIPPYTAREMIQDPPAAVVHSFRMHLWFKQFPSAGAYATRHYVPLHRDLWLPGLSANVAPGQRVTWIAPRAGRYRLAASDLLTKHPWFFNPVNYAMVAGTDGADYEIELRKLPPLDRSKLELTVDGKVVTEPVFELRKGSAVTLQSALPQRIGVLIVPHDLTTLFLSPEAPVLM